MKKDTNLDTANGNPLLKVQEVELVFKSKIPYTERIKIKGSADAYKVFKDNWSNQIGIREEFNILFLNNRNRVLAVSNISKGGINSTLVDVRIAFVTALKCGSTAMILGHNHPSGNLKPSASDIQLTQKFIEAGKILDIRIHDHIILSPEDDYYSFSDKCDLDVWRR